VKLECTGLARHFGGIRALQDVSLTLEEGEILGLVGPNGSGKSTLINVLSGVYRPTRGRVLLDGRDIGGMAPHRIAELGVARTYQIPRPFPSMTVHDNVAVSAMYGGSHRSLQAAREEAVEHLEFCGLGPVSDAFPAGINLHQRKFLEFARALGTRPRVLMLDEVMAGLNPSEIDESVEMVRRIHASGVTLIVVEHLMRVVTSLATRIVVLDQGMVLADGPPEQVMADEQVVAAYLGRQAHA
jgi:ABC-type branched-subunit amino acid transport system ATPase component